MGRTLLGIDLDESPMGGLIERLLSEEELEQLTDGGQPATPDDGETDTDGTDPDADADETEARSETSESTGGISSGPTPSPGPTSRAGASGRTDFSAAVDVDDGDSGGLRDRIPGVGGDGDGEESASRLAELRPLLLKIGVALAVLAVLALVAWRYLGRVKSAVPDVGPPSIPGLGGSGESDDADAVDDSDVSPARRRAKVGSADVPEESSTDGESVETGALTEESAVGDDAGEEPSERTGEGEEDTDDTVGAPDDDDVDVGALVGLAALALIAALVRKFGERDEYDPLVDGPEK